MRGSEPRGHELGLRPSERARAGAEAEGFYFLAPFFGAAFFAVFFFGAAAFFAARAFFATTRLLGPFFAAFAAAGFSAFFFFGGVWRTGIAMPDCLNSERT